MGTNDTRSVVVTAGEVTTRDGKSHKQGATLALDDVEARDLLRAGVVREADTKKKEAGV